MSDEIKHLRRREAELLETTNRYLMRARAAEANKEIAIKALKEITNIPNEDDGGDWDEIIKARAIASRAIEEIQRNS